MNNTDLTDVPEQQSNERHKQPGARRFLLVFVTCVVAIASLVATVNLIAYRYMLEPQNQSIVQLLSGWGRIYKPILYDEIKPEVAVFGASWARDAFDPVDTAQLLGRSVFNHGVSGGTGYETRRFADSALLNPNLQAAIINLNSFYRNERGARFRYGFDESILNVDANHQPNSFVNLRRAYSLALGGWAVGANIKLISTIRARDRGVARPDYLESYEQADHTRHNMKPISDRIFPTTVPGTDTIPMTSDTITITTEQPELEIMINGFCANNVDVYAYFTPGPARKMSCDPGAREELAALEFLRRKQQSCDTRIHYFQFSYVNAMTLEGVLTPVKSSRYFRPDGHPRPNAGLAMAASMFGKPFPADTSPLLIEDFGVDLLSHEDPEGWLLERAGRCQGDWGEDGHGAFKAALEKL